MGFNFDGDNKRINLTSGTTEFSVFELWSRWVDWVATDDNTKYLPAFRVVGGDPIDEGAGTYVTSYFFLLNGWRIKPQEANHKLIVTSGVLLVEGGGDPFVNTTGSYNVLVQYSQPVKTETVSTSGGSGGLTATEVRDAVWNALQLDYTLPGSMGYALGNANSVVSTLIKYQKNRTKVDQSAKTLTIYDDDGVTAVRVFALKDFSGLPSITEIAEKVPQ